MAVFSLGLSSEERKCGSLETEKTSVEAGYTEMDLGEHKPSLGTPQRYRGEYGGPPTGHRIEA